MLKGTPSADGEALKKDALCACERFCHAAHNDPAVGGQRLITGFCYRPSNVAIVCGSMRFGNCTGTSSSGSGSSGVTRSRIRPSSTGSARCSEHLGSGPSTGPGNRRGTPC